MYQIQLFWAIVEVYFATVFEKYAVLFNELNIPEMV
jgi:hypothetical protein